MPDDQNFPKGTPDGSHDNNVDMSGLNLPEINSILFSAEMRGKSCLPAKENSSLAQKDAALHMLTKLSEKLTLLSLTQARAALRDAIENAIHLIAHNGYFEASAALSNVLTRYRNNEFPHAIMEDERKTLSHLFKHYVEPLIQTLSNLYKFNTPYKLVTPQPMWADQFEDKPSKAISLILIGQRKLQKCQQNNNISTISDLLIALGAAISKTPLPKNEIIQIESNLSGFTREETRSLQAELSKVNANKHDSPHSIQRQQALANIENFSIFRDALSQILDITRAIINEQSKGGRE